MQQVVDLEGSQEFQSLEVALVSIATDPLEQLAPEARRWAIRAPLLSDTGGQVSRAYGALQWAMPSGEPGHTFVLVGKDGRVKWIRDYGAPQNGGLMYVAVKDLYQEVKARVSSP